MPDDQGNFKGIAVPELPWKDEPVIVHTAVHTSSAPDGHGRDATVYYWSCRCGQSSRFYRQGRHAEIAAWDHERTCAGAS